MDPDQRIREAVSLVYRKFTELRSIRQVHLWFAEKGLELPAAIYGSSGRQIIWKPPSSRTISGLLKNPVYARAYAWGRTTSRVHMDNGRKRVLHGVRLKADDWKVLIHDHHDGYITWADYERNQRLIADNAVVNKGAATRGATRAGKALLTLSIPSFNYQMTPKISLNTRCSISISENLSINGQTRSSDQLGIWSYNINP